MPLSRSAVRVRRLLVRRPWIYWIVVAGLAIGVAATVFDHVQGIDASRDSWGQTRAVMIAEVDTSPGESLAVVVRQLPVAMIPVSAIEPEPERAYVARQQVTAGEIVTEVDVAGAEATGRLALVPAGWLAVPIVESPPTGAEPGDRVRLSSEGVIVAEEALIAGHQDDVTLVAVPASIAPLVPVAAESGSLAVLLVP